MYIYHKQCEIKQKKSLKQLKRPNSLISHWFSVEMVHNGPKLCKSDAFFFVKKISEVSRVADIEVDKVADMEVDMVANMVVDKLVDMVVGMEEDIWWILP